MLKAEVNTFNKKLCSYCDYVSILAQLLKILHHQSLNQPRFVLHPHHALMDIYEQLVDSLLAGT